MRYDYNALQKFCNENNIELLQDYSKVILNRDTRIKGKCTKTDCENKFDKRFRTLENNSYCRVCSIKISREKAKQSCNKKYGCDHPSQSEEIKQKKIETCNKNFDCDHPTQNEEIQKKIIETNMERYGCERPLQNSEVMEKMSKNSYKFKDYTFPSGNQIKYQGYEHYALDELLKEGILEEEIINGCKNVPEVWYEDEQGKEHRYYVDIFIPSQNRCIEVKSTWTAEKKKDCIFLKQQALKEAGYECEIWVYNGKGEKVECYK